MTDSPKVFDVPKFRPDLIEFLSTRRSNLAKMMDGQGEGPSAEQIRDILTIGTRVPDHRKLTPWRFLIFQGGARTDIGKHIAAIFTRHNPEASHDRAIFEGQRFLRAPLVIGVISSPIDCPRGTPKWEQGLSAGTVCYNLCLAAQAHGFGAQWLTEWYSYDADIRKALGVASHEKIAGFIHIGKVDVGSTVRARPDLDGYVEMWSDTAKA